MFERIVVIVLMSILVVPGSRAHAAAGTHLFWSDNGHLTRQARELADVLGAAADEGLRPGDYMADAIAAQIVRLSAPPNDSAVDWPAFDRLLSTEAIHIATDLHLGRIDPRAAGFELKQSRPPIDPAATLVALSTAPDLRAAVAKLEPPFYHYRLLKAALARYRILAADPSLTGIPPIGRQSLGAGDAYDGAPALRRLLTALGDLRADSAVPDAYRNRLDPLTVDALKRFQTRHGLAPEGSLGAQTYAQLTMPLAQRVRQIELTLERWRWLPPFDSPPIIVNIPQFRLFAFRTTTDRAADIMQMDVIVGQTYPRTRTPVFVGDLKYVIFRPYWDVPRSIVEREMLPAIARHPEYLERNKLDIVEGESDAGAVRPANAASIDGLRSGRLRLRQRPGDDNALGLIKFIFPNEHNVYMHSTPAHRLFMQSRRAFSHGCIRVSDPNALAAFVLRNAAGAWTPEAILAAMQHGPNSARVPLDKPIRVMILYATAQARPVLRKNRRRSGDESGPR